MDGSALLTPRFLLSAAIRVVNGPVSVTEGDIANLTCVLIETDEDLGQVTWQKRTRQIPENHNFLVIIPPQDVRHVDGLGDRVRFTGDLTKKTGSIQLLNVSLQDEGVYTCIFTVFPSGPHQTEIRLNVRGKFIMIAFCLLKRST